MTAPLPIAALAGKKAPPPDVRPLKVFGLTLGLLGLTAGAQALGVPAVLVAGGFAAGAVLCLVSVADGLRAVFGAPPLPSALGTLTLLGPVVGGAALSFTGAFMALWALRRG